MEYTDISDQDVAHRRPPALDELQALGECTIYDRTALRKYWNAPLVQKSC